MGQLRQVEPGDLHLPPGRQSGAVLWRYQKQKAAFGSATKGMPPLEVTEGRGGALMINNGVTRATRIHYLAPGQLVTVEITEVRAKADFSRLRKVRDVPPPC